MNYYLNRKTHHRYTSSAALDNASFNEKGKQRLDNICRIT